MGLGDDVTSVTRLTLIEALKDEDIVDVQSSYMHSLALTKNGKVSNMHNVFCDQK